MSLFEWLFERGKYHEVGDIKSTSEIEETQPSRFRFWATFIIGQTAFWFIIDWAKQESFIENKTIWFIAFSVYLFLALIMRPEPKYSNMGWLNGLIDNPFRITDDYNRMLFLTMIILYPGRIITESFIYLIQLMASFILYLFKDVKP
jgi:hypothetical protein